MLISEGVLWAAHIVLVFRASCSLTILEVLIVAERRAESKDFKCGKA